MTDVAWPGRRQDVIEALHALATLERASMTQMPTLDDAVHWLIDDTWWDQTDPATYIGLILRDTDEVTAIQAVIRPLLELIDELEPTESDMPYINHSRWPTLRAAARAAHDRLCAPGQRIDQPDRI